MKTKHLVIDTAAFVKILPLWEYGEELYSVPEVIAELRDKVTRQRYDSLPVAVKMKEPQPWSIRFINQFSKKTGDYASLSLADVKILALTYELEIEARGSSSHLRTVPQKCVVEGPNSKPKADDQENIEGFHLPSGKNDDVTNSPDVPPFSETLNEDAKLNSSNDSLSDPGTGTNLDQGLSLPSPDNNSLSCFASDAKETVNVFWCHMLGLEDFLVEHSYLGGHSPTSDDANVYEALTKEYPQFQPLPTEECISDSSSLTLSPSHTMRPLHSTFPCIRRWSYHISSFSEEERSLFTSSGRDIRDVLGDFGGRVRIRENSSKIPDLVGQNTLLNNALQWDMSALSLADHVDESSGKETEEGNESEAHGFGGLEAVCILEDVGSYTEESEKSESCSWDEEASVDYENEPKELENGDSHDIDENDDDDEDDDDDDDDDEEGWITPINIKRHKLNSKNNPADLDEEKEEDVLVACVTSDFAIQNVLKHIGLSVMGVDGKIISQIKTYILRCYACFKTCSDMSKIFCPKCGNKTLKRVSVTVNPDGTQKIWINFKKPINTKGMIFTLPRPRGGQHARNPILVADQREVRQFSSNMSKKTFNPLHEDYDPNGAPFAVRDVYSRASQLGYVGGKCHNHYYWEQKNPNARTKKGKRNK